MSAQTLQRACRSVDLARCKRDEIVYGLHLQGLSMREIAQASQGQLSHSGVAIIIKRLKQQEQSS